MRLVALHEMGAHTAQSCAAPQPVLTRSKLRESEEQYTLIPPFMRTPQRVQLRDFLVLFETACVQCCSR